ncbi:DDE-type integrase/transposase/recombinase [candidate division TA06 bacterium]|uniref:DDE-type integrase/transposase/recombinase n=1 Tax=candidate division TA06 bacterium TaxID=2250710 RepID=A0A933IFU4_UNCT6|nr:DDE-type integrase/transposase/recombinase [candidate division TA06 bacterium]
MDKETREQIALIRYKIISPVLAEPARLQNEYFRSQAQKEHMFPHYGLRQVSVSTMKSWLKTFKKKGFHSLYPKARCDTGRPRRATKDMLNVIRARCKAYPHLTTQKLYENLSADHLLGQPSIHYNTLLRIVKKENLLVRKRQDVRKRYEAEHVNDLWVCDFMHGPRVLINRRPHKAILCAIIDDHSRMITGHAFAPSETVASLTRVLKDAFLAFGLPKRVYVDNGSAFSSEFLVKCCALAGISLIHSRPYDSPSRGKIERVFRTIRDRFLSEITEMVTLQELNAAFASFLNDYHHRVHSSIKETPLDRYNRSVGEVEIKRVSRPELDEIFLVRHERVVNNDATISFKGSVYEVPAAYIRQRIEIRHPVDDNEELFLYDNDVRVGRLKLVDTRENARVFKPDLSGTVLSFADGRVEK